MPSTASRQSIGFTETSAVERRMTMNRTTLLSESSRIKLTILPVCCHETRKLQRHCAEKDVLSRRVQ